MVAAWHPPGVPSVQGFTSDFAGAFTPWPCRLEAKISHHAEARRAFDKNLDEAIKGEKFCTNVFAHIAMARTRYVVLSVAAAAVVALCRDRQPLFVLAPSRRLTSMVVPIAVNAIASVPALADETVGATSTVARQASTFAPWNSDFLLEPFPGVAPNPTFKNLDQALVMSASMDGKFLHDAVMAHRRAVESTDGRLVTSVTDVDVINAVLGKLVVPALVASP